MSDPEGEATHAFSHEGDRQDQEDAFLTVHRPGAVLCALCDAGGGGGGSARPAADLVLAFLREAFDVGLPPEGVSDVLQAAHRTLQERAEADRTAVREGRYVSSAWRYIETTADVAFFVPGRVHLAHVGNGRIYRARGALLERLMVEQNGKEHWQKAYPSLTPEQLENIPGQGRVLLRALGFAGALEVETAVVETRPGDTFLLGSDGLFDLLTDHPIAALLRRAPGRAGAAQALVEAALQVPAPPHSRDNLTAVVHHVGADGL